MIIDFQQPLTDVYGKPLPANADGEPTLARVAVQALLGEKQGETVPPAKQGERWRLATRIAQSVHPVDLTYKQVAEIKERIAMFHGLSIIGPAYDLIERSRVRHTLGSDAYSDISEVQKSGLELAQQMSGPGDSPVGLDDLIDAVHVRHPATRRGNVRRAIERLEERGLIALAVRHPL